MARRRTHHSMEPHDAGLAARLNWLRASVLGANDGIVSTASLVIGVAGAGASRTAIVTAGVAGLVAGSLSMAAGEYASVSSQRDSQRQLIALETRELQEIPEAELHELAGIYQSKGLSPELAKEVAIELTEHDALRAHAEAELNIDIDEIVSPWAAAIASALAFALGAVLPMIAVLATPHDAQVIVTGAVVVLALALTGAISAKLGRAPIPRAVVRNVASGLVAMSVTYGVGYLFGTTVG